MPCHHGSPRFTSRRAGQGPSPATSGLSPPPPRPPPQAARTTLPTAPRALLFPRDAPAEEAAGRVPEAVPLWCRCGAERPPSRPEPSMAEPDPKSVQDLTAVVQTLLQQMQDKFQTMSDQIIGRIDDMSCRIDDLEKNIADLMTQAGVEELEGENKTPATNKS